MHNFSIDSQALGRVSGKMPQVGKVIVPFCTYKPQLFPQNFVGLRLILRSGLFVTFRLQYQ